jgi:undecaprenyl-diphosphatase
MLNGATAISAIIYYRDNLAGMAKALLATRKSSQERTDAVFFIVVTSITTVVGFPLYLAFKGLAVSGGLLLTIVASLLMLFTGVLSRKRELFLKKNIGKKQQLHLPDGVILGLSQSLATLPGVSRSGITLATMLGSGYSTERSIVSSFIAGIPVSLGITILDLFDGVLSRALDDIGLFPVLCMFLVAMLVGILTLGSLTRASVKVRFSTLSFIVGVLGLFSVLLLLL